LKTKKAFKKLIQDNDWKFLKLPNQAEMNLAGVILNNNIKKCTFPVSEYIEKNTP
jgi:hypothetical protein